MLATSQDFINGLLDHLPQKLQLIADITKFLAQGVSVPKGYELASAYASLNGHPIAMVADPAAAAELVVHLVR